MGQTMYATVGNMNAAQVMIAKLEDKGWTQAAIARELGVSYNTVQKWKAGDRKPSNYQVVLERLESLCRRRRIPKKRQYLGI